MYPGSYEPGYYLCVQIFFAKLPELLLHIVLDFAALYQNGKDIQHRFYRLNIDTFVIRFHDRFQLRCAHCFIVLTKKCHIAS